MPATLLPRTLFFVRFVFRLKIGILKSNASPVPPDCPRTASCRTLHKTTMVLAPFEVVHPAAEKSVLWRHSNRSGRASVRSARCGDGSGLAWRLRHRICLRRHCLRKKGFFHRYEKGFLTMIARTEAAPTYLPTPTQIRDECLAIRRRWSVRERESRRTDGSKAWRVLVALILALSARGGLKRKINGGHKPQWRCQAALGRELCRAILADECASLAVRCPPLQIVEEDHGDRDRIRRPGCAQTRRGRS